MENAPFSIILYKMCFRIHDCSWLRTCRNHWFSLDCISRGAEKLKTPCEYWQKHFLCRLWLVSVIGGCARWCFQSWSGSVIRTGFKKLTYDMKMCWNTLFLKRFIHMFMFFNFCTRPVWASQTPEVLYIQAKSMVPSLPDTRSVVYTS